jgi:Lar family restriction alleviation protein
MNDSPGASSLSPCPFCGGDALICILWLKENFYYTWFIQCVECDSRTKEYDEEQLAINAWERRQLLNRKEKEGL